jgi:peptidoglycan hydrolase-like protein with peptidoglycan-binding domain
VANVLNFRSTIGRDSTSSTSGGAPTAPRRSGLWRYVFAGGMLLVVAVVAAGVLILVSAHASLTADANGIAKVGMPLGGGSIERVSAVTGPHSQPVPIEVRGGTIWPQKLIPANARLSVDVVVKRPGWDAWLAGNTEHLHLSMTTPVASLRSHYLTVSGHGQLRLRFKQPIQSYSYGQLGHLRRHVLASPQSVVKLPRSAPAGTVFVSAAPRSWERSPATLVSWFPAGADGSAVANPAPGSTIKPNTPLTLTFSRPLRAALGSHRPPVPTGATGAWSTVNSHTLRFEPTGYGYGLGAKVTVALPHGVQLVGGQHSATADAGTWVVPGGSTVRLQQMLSLLNYLPLKFHYKGPGVGLTPESQLSAAVSPPAGRFSFRYSNTPPALKHMWQPGSMGTVTKGALMAFQTDHGLTADGIAGPALWRTLIKAVVGGHRSSFGYTFVTVSEASQALSLWHNGRTVLHTPVNTGIPSAPTATGTFPVYEHLPVTTMSGTNPDGSHYSDPGIQWVSYFNGGDALHGFTRAQFGFPQSLGCVEMPVGTAGQVYPFTPIGTLVDVV